MSLRFGLCRWGFFGDVLRRNVFKSGLESLDDEIHKEMSELLERVSSRLKNRSGYFDVAN
mgnify:CR=1 FL=1